MGRTNQYGEIVAVNFYFDHVTRSGLPYPNLAHTVAKPGQIQWYQFDHQWPFVSHFRPLLYLRDTNHHINIVTQQDTDNFQHAWFPVQFGWFDFCIDYPALIPNSTQDLIRQNKLTVLFCYHEGDNPELICQRISDLWLSHDLPTNSWRLISSNSAASDLANCFYFDDHEHFFRLLNREQQADPVPHSHYHLKYVFTCLIRQHKDWRLAFMADLWQDKIIANQSYWSYNTAELPLNFDAEMLCINAALLPGLTEHVEAFKSQTPKFCDEMTSDQHNDHTHVDIHGYTQSMCNVVFETNFDNGGAGVFLSEKTWKCIKYGQPFVIVGAPHSLERLRARGYRTFDRLIDNSYDQITDNTQRWLRIKNTLSAIAKFPPRTWWRQCHADLVHNQKLFELRGHDGLTDLMEFLDHD